MISPKARDSPQGSSWARSRRASFELTGRVTDLVLAGALPDMVVASVKRALTPEGVEDRKLLLAHMGFFEGATPPSSSGTNQTQPLNNRSKRSPNVIH